MLNYHATEIAAMVGGRLIGPDVPVTGLSYDSRTTQPGDLFFALAGERVDGHQYVAGALATGAAAVADARRLPTAVERHWTLIDVPDPLAALGALATRHRERHPARVVGVTGSLGKTTTKDLIAAVLGRRYPTLKNRGNLNTEIGVPLTLLELTPEHEVAVIEMAMRGRGQIRELARMAEPEIGVITNIGLSHLELLGSQDAIAEAKAELLEALPPTGTAILNADDPYCDFLSTRALRSVRFGFAPEADVRCEGIARRTDGAAFRWSAPAFGVDAAAASIPIPGRHNIANALAAIAAGLWLKVSPEEIAAGLERAEISAMRMEIVRSPEGYLVLNDAYNASSPEAMLAALEVLATQAAGRRQVAVLGSMLELGPASEAAHRQVGEAVAAPGGPDLLVTVGELAASAAAAAREAGMLPEQVIACEDNQEALERLRRRLRPDDVVLVKGSRGMAMEALVRGLLQFRPRLLSA
jgi:UDP-N-acetylmuramoyl-tripeptide--D-alanyl-D-alanine ligase